ncbi:MAG: aminotransferase class V-fold PLP-dependent enzyme [Bdellovibrionia bacterium]
MYKNFYSRFLSQQNNKIYFTAHSHHFWPDITRDAHLQYWDDAATMVDDKWSYIFSKKIPNAQQLIAEILGVDSPQQISFAPNTHELVMRVLSCFDPQKKLTVLTTDSEFYSFDRQIKRYAEVFANLEVVRVPTEPFATFTERFTAIANKVTPDLVFFSHVFFNSGWVCDFSKIASQLPQASQVVVDGYHGFMAIPTTLKALQNRIFYLAGSYKYAQGGEGCCFLYSPPQTTLKPYYTGWFAELSSLQNRSEEVAFPDDGLRFAGSTMDFAALYRLEASLLLFKQKELTVEKIHQYVSQLQNQFLEGLAKSEHPVLKLQNILPVPAGQRGHFLTFALADERQTAMISLELKNLGILTDSRKNRLRFGFGLHLTQEDIEKCLQLLKK